MKEFHGIGSFVAHLATIAAAETISLHRGLEKCAVAIEKTAKDEIGHYQDEVGPFAAWAELADSTKEDRLRKGFSENNPLERTHDLENSISHERHGYKAVVGSSSDIMVYQEIGNEKIPPRAVLGPAAIRNKDLIMKVLGHAAAEGLLYGAGVALTKLE